MSALSFSHFAGASSLPPAYRAGAGAGSVPRGRRVALSEGGAQSGGDPDGRADPQQAPGPAPEDWAGAMCAIRDRRDAVAFGRLFDHFAPRLKGFLIRSGLDPVTAEDCVQEVMAVCWQRAHLYDPTRASVATWLFTIARNRRIDLLRRKRPEPEDLPWGPEPEPDPEAILSLNEACAALSQAVARLPDAQRSLIEAAYFADRTQTEIATLTGLPLGTIKSRIRLALIRLRGDLT